MSVHGNEDHVFGTETTHLGGFFKGIVAVDRGEENKLMVAISVFFGFGVENVAGDDYGGCV